MVCDGVSVWNLSPLWCAQALFTFYPDRLHKTEPKHQTEKTEGMVVAWGIKSNLLSASIHHFIRPSSPPPLTSPSIPRLLPPKKIPHNSPSFFRRQRVPTCARNQIRALQPIHKSLCLSVDPSVRDGKLWNHEWIYSIKTLFLLPCFLFHHALSSGVSGVCAFGLWPSTTTTLWPAAHSLVMHQVAVCTLNTSLLIRGMQRMWERERERESQLYRSVFSVITHNWEIRRASNLERRLIDGVCLPSEKHLRVNVRHRENICSLSQTYHPNLELSLQWYRRFKQRCMPPWELGVQSVQMTHPTLYWWKQSASWFQRTGIKGSCLFFSVRDWHRAKWC